VHDPKANNGTSSLRSRLGTTVPLRSKPWSQATPDFPGQKGRLVPMTPYGPFGFGHGDKDDGTILFPRSAKDLDPDRSLKLQSGPKGGKSIRGGGTGLRFSSRFARPKLDRWSA